MSTRSGSSRAARSPRAPIPAPPVMAGPGRCRPSRTPTWCSAIWTRTSSSGARCASTSRRRERRSTRTSPSRSVSPSNRPRGASTAWSTRTWPAPPACTPPLATDAVRSRLEPVDEQTLARVEPLFAKLEQEGTAILSSSGVTDITHERSVDMRYVGQGFEVTVPVVTGEDLKAAFETAYVRAHGRMGPDVPTEAISWRVLSRGPDPALRLLAAPAGDGDALKGTRDVYLDGAYRETPIFDRYRMTVGTQIEGPAIVEERESTTVVGAGATARVAEDGSLIVEMTV